MTSSWQVNHTPHSKQALQAFHKQGISIEPDKLEGPATTHSACIEVDTVEMQLVAC